MVMTPAEGAVYTLSDAFKSSAFVRDSATVGDRGANGAVIIGKDLTTGGNAYKVALKAGAVSVQGNALAVGDTIFLPNSQNGGSVQVSAADFKAVTSFGAARMNGAMNGAKLGAADEAKYIQSSGGLVSGATSSVTEAFSNLELLSERIATLAAVKGTAITLDSGDQGKFVLSSSATAVTDSSIMKQAFRLYNLDASLLQGVNPLTASSLGLTSLGKEDLIVINVVNAAKYDSVTLRLQLADDWAGKVLWNVDGAASLKTGPSSFNGTLLAPESAFTNQDRTFNGSMIVQSYMGSKAGDMNLVEFGGTMAGTSTGSIVVAPEPTSALIGGLLALGLWRRQRR